MRCRSVMLALVAALAVATPALAARTPSHSEKQQITRAIKRKLSHEGSPLARRVRVSGVRISTRNRHWARATISASGADSAYVALRKHRGHWRVLSLGTAQVQCGLGMPKPVMRELFRRYGGTNCG